MGILGLGKELVVEVTAVGVPGAAAGDEDSVAVGAEPTGEESNVVVGTAGASEVTEIVVPAGPDTDGAGADEDAGAKDSVAAEEAGAEDAGAEDTGEGPGAGTGAAPFPPANLAAKHCFISG